MGDLFLHLPFARRLRLAEGLHPLASEAVVRRPALVALGAALTHLPETERKGMSFFRRLFSRGGEGARWQKLLAPAAAPRVDLLVALLARADGHAFGSLARLAIGLGFLSHEVLEASVAPLLANVDGSARRGIERAQARLWLQHAVPRARD